MIEKRDNRASENLRASKGGRMTSYTLSLEWTSQGEKRFSGILNNPVLRAPTSTFSTSLFLPFSNYNMEIQAETGLSWCLLTASYICSSLKGMLSVTRFE